MRRLESPDSWVGRAKAMLESTRPNTCTLEPKDTTTDDFNDARVTKTVLIVEDNDLNMKLFRGLLEAQRYRTLEAYEGMEGLRLARENRPDLILMDIQLPEVSGLEITKWLKDDDDLKAIPVTAVTAFAMKGDEEKIRKGGCDAYISKPISVHSFIETVEKFLR
jgi:two-component system cell cycle response regulator DivK